MDAIKLGMPRTSEAEAEAEAEASMRE